MSIFLLQGINLKVLQAQICSFLATLWAFYLVAIDLYLLPCYACTSADSATDEAAELAPAVAADVLSAYG